MSKTLLQRLKSRKELVQRKPVIEFKYPNDETPECIFKVKRLFGEDVREASNKLARSNDDETKLNPFYNALFKKLVPNVESVVDMNGEDYDIKEMRELMLRHFDQLEVTHFVLGYYNACAEDEQEAEADPNE